MSIVSDVAGDSSSSGELSVLEPMWQRLHPCFEVKFAIYFKTTRYLLKSKLTLASREWPVPD
jgi:hypothetical protein